MVQPEQSESSPEQQARTPPVFKVTLTGDAMAGKTMLRRHLAKRAFLEKYIATQGVDFTTSTVDTADGDKIQLQVCEVPGQEDFRNVQNYYYNGAHAVIILYDVTKPDSLSSVKRWLAHAKASPSYNAALFFLAATKMDLLNTEEDRAVRDNPEVKAQVEDLFPVSAKTGQGVDKMFQTITGVLLSRRPNKAGLLSLAASRDLAEPGKGKILADAEGEKERAREEKNQREEEKREGEKERAWKEKKQREEKKREAERKMKESLKRRRMGERKAGPAVQKVLLVGEEGVGKSQLLQRWAQDSFSNSYSPTIGIDFTHTLLTLHTQDDVKLQIWDTAGQPRFRTITASYYRGADAFVIVYDVTDAKSYDTVTYWLREVYTQNLESVVTVVVGTKSDAKDKGGSYFGVEQLKKDLESGDAQGDVDAFFETSAKTGEGVREVFTELARLVWEKKGGGEQERTGSKPSKTCVVL